MQERLSSTVLRGQNQRFQGAGGRSEENRGIGFRPAFMDTDTRTIYPSCFADGRPAPVSPHRRAAGCPDRRAPFIETRRHPESIRDLWLRSGKPLL
jgi:hypothetical protein